MRHEETSTRSRRTRVAIKRGKTVPLAAPAVSDKRVVELGADREEEEKRGTKGWWGRQERRGGEISGRNVNETKEATPSHQNMQLKGEQRGEDDDEGDYSFDNPRYAFMVALNKSL